MLLLSFLCLLLYLWTLFVCYSLLKYYKTQVHLRLKLYQQHIRNDPQLLVSNQNYCQGFLLFSCPTPDRRACTHCLPFPTSSPHLVSSSPERFRQNSPTTIATKSPMDSLQPRGWTSLSHRTPDPSICSSWAEFSEHLGSLPFSQTSFPHRLFFFSFAHTSNIDVFPKGYTWPSFCP